MRSMPGASPHRPAEPLVRRMGSLRVRLALRTEAEAVDGDGDGDSGGDRDRDLAMPAISVVASTAASPPTRRDPQQRQPERDDGGGGGGDSDGDQGESRREQRLLLQRSAAMDFLPQEAVGGQQSPQPSSERLAGFCGVSLFHVGRLKLPDALCGDRDRQGSPCFLVLCCRTASASSGPKRIKVPYPTLAAIAHRTAPYNGTTPHALCLYVCVGERERVCVWTAMSSSEPVLIASSHCVSY